MEPTESTGEIAPESGGQSLRRVAKNTLVSLVGRLLNFAIAPFFAVAAANSLGPTGYGRFTLGFSIAMFAQAIADAGMSLSLSREVAVARSRASTLCGAAVLTNALISVLAFAVISFVVLFWNDRGAVAAIWILTSGVFFLAFARMCEGLAAGFERFELQVVPSIVRNVSLVAICVPIVIMHPERPNLFAASVVLAWAISAIVSWRWTASRLAVALVWPGREEWLGTVRRSVPYLLMPLATILYVRNDVWSLTWLLGPSPAGIYQAGYTMLEWSSTFPALFASALLPTLSRLFATDRSGFHVMLSRILRVVAGLAPLMAAGTMLLSAIVLPHYRQGFEQSVSLGLILSMTAAPSTLNYSLGTALLVVGRPYRILGAVLVGTALKMTLNLLLIPLYGPAACAFGTTAIEWVTAGLQATSLALVLAEDRAQAPWRAGMVWALMVTSAMYAAWALLGNTSGVVVMLAYGVLFLRSRNSQAALRMLLPAIASRAPRLAKLMQRIAGADKQR